ncbi:MAG: DNA translocase FtsK 4TM domain-containing protein [Bacteroidales bacterium]|nr:DNA translocase FtsK 4TM domain-containing protein [Bacteroidales bacterium]
MRFWHSWDEEERAAAVRIAGLCVAALTLFIFISTFSYLFHWREDMSLLGDPDAMQAGRAVGNAAGKLGFRMGHLLVCELFGLGSFSLLIILTAVSVRLLAHRWSKSLVKTALIALFGAFIASIVLAYAGKCAGQELLFGGGLGGRCGAAVVAWAENLFGTIVTGLFLVILTAAFLFFSSKRFNRWFASIGQKKEKPAKEPDAEELEEEAEEEAAEELEEASDSLAALAGEAIPEGIPDTVLDTLDEAETPGLAGEEAEAVPGAVPAGADGNFEIVADNGLEAEQVEDLSPIDNRLDPPDGLPKYKFPSLDLLESYSSGRREVSTEELTRNNNKIRAALSNYKIQVTDVKAIVGPTVTLYKVYPAPGVKIADIKKLQEDIALSLNAKGVRVVTLSDAVGIEVANDFSSIVPLKALLNDEAFRNSKADLPVAIGYTITQKVRVFDLADAPHLLIAGATKQGKSVGLNVIVSSLLYSKHPSELKFVFIDPKMVEFSAYGQLLKHYLAVLPDSTDEDDERANAIVKKPKDAEKILRSLCTEMDDRYELLSKAGVNKITLYNEKFKERKLRPDHGHRYLPYLVVVVDEYADLTMTTGASPDARAASRSITNSIIRLAQKGRAAGLHVILATQRPSVDVISGIIKSNFPMRIAFRVASRVDSMTILDAPGAEKLIGRGDMLFSAGIDSERIQCGFISGEEIDTVTEFIGEQVGYGRCYNTPYYLPSPAEPGAEGGEGGGMVDMSKVDDRFEEAAKMVVLSQRGSTSDLQRKLGMGYAKAGRVMDQLEAAGIVGPQEGSKPRQVLVPDLNTLEPILDAFLHRI